jgi:hypothetical protein
MNLLFPIIDVGITSLGVLLLTSFNAGGGTLNFEYNKDIKNGV